VGEWLRFQAQKTARSYPLTFMTLSERREMLDLRQDVKSVFNYITYVYVNQIIVKTRSLLKFYLKHRTLLFKIGINEILAIEAI
jgi:hypothetical protein